MCCRDLCRPEAIYTLRRALARCFVLPAYSKNEQAEFFITIRLVSASGYIKTTFCIFDPSLPNLFTYALQSVRTVWFTQRFMFVNDAGANNPVNVSST